MKKLCTLEYSNKSPLAMVHVVSQNGDKKLIASTLNFRSDSDFEEWFTGVRADYLGLDLSKTVSYNMPSIN